MCYSQSVSFIEFLMDFCIYDDILDTILITDKKLLHFKLSKSGEILSVDKTGFPRPGHILISISMQYTNEPWMCLNIRPALNKLALSFHIM